MWHFTSSWVLGGRDVSLSLDLVFWGECVFKMEFCWGWVGWFYFDFLGDYYLLRGHFVYYFFLCFAVELY